MADVTPSSEDRLAKARRSLLETQFVFYRRLVAKKHNMTVWLDVAPAEMPDPDLEQAVAFLRDAAHLPPG